MANLRQTLNTDQIKITVSPVLNFVIMIFLFWAFIIYLVFKVMTRLVIPVWRTTRQIRTAFKDAQSHMQEVPVQQQRQQNTNSSRPPAGDYIEFEEIKD